MLRASWEERVRGIGGNPEFVRFLRERFRPTWEEDYFLLEVDKALRAKEYRRLKRKLQKGDLAGWRDTWQQIVLPHLTRRLEVRFRKNAAQSEFAVTDGAAPRGRPTDRAYWRLVWALQAYFRWLSGNPNWPLMSLVQLGDGLHPRETLSL